MLTMRLAIVLFLLGTAPLAAQRFIPLPRPSVPVRPPVAPRIIPGGAPHLPHLPHLSRGSSSDEEIAGLLVGTITVCLLTGVVYASLWVYARVTDDRPDRVK